MSDRNEEIEVKIAFLEDSLAKLSDEFYTQQKELDLVKGKLLLLTDKLRTVDDGGHGDLEITDERPPHY